MAETEDQESGQASTKPFFGGKDQRSGSSEEGIRNVIEERADLEELIEVFDDFMKNTKNKDSARVYADNNLGKIAVSYDTLQKFLTDLSKYEAIDPTGFNYLGFFLEKLIDKLSPESIMNKKIKLSVKGIPNFGYLGSNLDWKFLDLEGNAGDYLGYFNAGRIDLSGHAGDYAGAYMERGILNIFGNVGGSLGYQMSGGEIYVKGGVGDYAGVGMKRGVIKIDGRSDRSENLSVGDYLGQDMAGGKIIVDGDSKDYLGQGMSGGEILVYGKVGAEAGMNSTGGIIRMLGNFQGLGINCNAKIIRE